MRVETTQRRSPARVVLIGVGNPWRLDDGAGREVARRLADRVSSGVEVLGLDGGAAELLEAWEGRDLALVVDALRISRSPRAATGTGAAQSIPGVVAFDARHGPLPAVLASNFSSHGLGLAEAVELGRRLGRLPRRLLVYGIEGRDFRPGKGLTPCVASAVEELTERLAVFLEP